MKYIHGRKNMKLLQQITPYLFAYVITMFERQNGHVGKCVAKCVPIKRCIWNTRRGFLLYLAILPNCEEFAEKKSQFAEWYSHTALAVSFFYSPFQKYCTNLYLLCKLSFWVWRILSNSTISKNVLKEVSYTMLCRASKTENHFTIKSVQKLANFFKCHKSGL